MVRAFAGRAAGAEGPDQWGRIKYSSLGIMSGAAGFCVRVDSDSADSDSDSDSESRSSVGGGGA